jgi:lipooligosaccharide transport system permease protein
MAAGVGLVLVVMGLLRNPAAVLLFPLIGGMLAVPCGAIGLLAAARVRNINQFQTVYSFLIAPIYFLSGVFFPLADRPILGVIVQFSPFYHGVRLLQMAAWMQGSAAEVAYHVGALFAFMLVLGFWAHFSIRGKLTA